MASMFSAAASFLNRTNISQSYTILTPGQNAAPPSNSGLPSLPVGPPFQAGLWNIQPAQHKINGKRVSVWTFEKRSPEMDRLGQQARDMVLEALKAEASALRRLRHPSILEMVEPLEETRSILTFATEPLTSTLQQVIPTSSTHSRNADDNNELDEIEIQKGVLQLSKGLAFLHQSAKVVHTNITPYTVLINQAGDWKLSGLGMTIPLTNPDGTPTRWEFPESHSSLPYYVQRNFDYMAPEYAIDEQISTSSDMFALGCLLYAVHNKGSPPFRNHSSLSTLKSNMQSGIQLRGMEGWDPDLRSLLSQLITRSPTHPIPRPTPETIPQNSFFNSLPISTLNFLERSNFASKSREEKIAFMKGLNGVLDRFSRGLRERKILSALLEEMKDPYLLPSILPNVFTISNDLSPSQFASRVLPTLKPLFAVKEPPQNMLTLLDNLKMLQEKTDAAVFKEHVLPLVYNALESEHTTVVERALAIVPDLCETIDYNEVQSVLFPRVALVFTKTKILSVKVNTLVCFLSMVKTLDTSSLTQKLVPLLAKIRTKEPAVMMATLNVHEAMGFKVDREAVATLVLPHLWTMSMGPLLNVTQFARFMSVIKALGERVEKEHGQYLRDSQRNEDRSAIADPSGMSTPQMGGTIDFQSLVSGSAAAKLNGLAAASTNDGASTGSWEDAVWGSMLSGAESPRASTPSTLVKRSTIPAPPLQHTAEIKPFSPSPASRPISTLGTTSTISSPTTHNPSPILPPPPRNNLNASFHRTQSSLSTSSTPSITSIPLSQPIAPSPFGMMGSSSSVMQPTTTQSAFKPAIPPPPSNKPNYNISISSAPSTSTSIPPPIPSFPIKPTSSLTGPRSTNTPPPPSMVPMMSTNTGMMAPAAPSQPSWNAIAPTRMMQPMQPKKVGKDDWGDFDPLA
ncbi:related to bovine rhodopsin kinase and to YGR052w [Serendipita indica DSM 11827]|uniref:Related to bovine rhodopsin kinase and to YGR052w n=1 Tax=Serendipita indica (strain DSM 11827) TaxID=1109443 RepID=G4TAU1_SERID|nr:related to bovine rhodopsin kinase and to YGR052w [Serendipita indica DSM 11827]